MHTGPGVVGSAQKVPNGKTAKHPGSAQDVGGVEGPGGGVEGPGGGGVETPGGGGGVEGPGGGSVNTAWLSWRREQDSPKNQ